MRFGRKLVLNLALEYVQRSIIMRCVETEVVRLLNTCVDVGCNVEIGPSVEVC